MAEADPERVKFESGADELRLHEQSFTIRDASWCLPCTTNSISASFYDRAVFQQRYDKVMLISFGKAQRSVFLLVFAFLLSIFAAAGAGLYTKNIMNGAYAGVGGFAVGFALFIYVRSADIRMQSETNYYGVIGGPLSFTVNTNPDQIYEIAGAFLEQHARVWGLDWMGLDNLAEITTTRVRSGLFCGEHKLYICGHYVVVYKKESFLGLCFESESYEAFPLTRSTFIEYSNAGRHIMWLVLWALIFLGVGAIQGEWKNGLIFGCVVGFLHWLGSGKQHMTFGILGGFAVRCRVPYGLEDPANLGLEIIKPLFPAELQHELDNNAEPSEHYVGHLPEGSNTRDAGSIALAIIKLPVTIIVTILKLPYLMLCAACGRTGRQDAQMRVYTHHVTTHTNQALVCFWVARFREGALYAFVKNMLGWSDTYYISVLRNVPVIKCNMPGLQGPCNIFMFGAFLGMIAGGIGTNLPDGSGEKNAANAVAAAIFGLVTLTAIIQFVTRRATIYLGEEEHIGYGSRLGREFHHVQFAALGKDADQIVRDLAVVQSKSIARCNAAVAGGAPKV